MCRAALRHLMAMLIELREAATLPKRVLELAIVTVSKLNACHYCVAHHTPFLVVEGVSPAGVERLLDYRDHPEFDEGTNSSSNMRSPPGSARTASRTRCSPGCAAFQRGQLVELTLRITLCGFFNKFNDALRIEEEPEAVERLSGAQRLRKIAR